MVKRPHQNMWKQLISLSGEANETLQVQLRKALARLIVEQRISLEVPLPSSRELAEMLQVSRSTVTLAFQRLVDDGYLISLERKGYFVNPERVGAQTSATQPADAGTDGERDWSMRLRHNVSGQRNIQKPGDWYNYPYPFTFGQIDSNLLPLSDWRDCWRYALGARSMAEGGYDRLDQDHADLVQQLCTRVLPQRGIWAKPDNVLVTLGAQNALAMLARLLIKPTDAVGVENPGYPDARNLFGLETENIRLLPVDNEGLVVNSALDECAYLYVTPSFQSPTTVTLSAQRRQALLAKAEQHDIIIIEDDYESEAAFGDEPVPSLKSQDTHNRVIYCGSLSKSLAPGLRLGFLVADTALINEARALRRLTLRHPPSLIERTVAHFIDRGHYDSQVNRLARAYRQRWQAMAEALDTYFPFADRRHTFGGTSFWIEGPANLDADQVALEAAKQGILIEPGAVHFAESEPPRNYFRLGFSAIASEKIEPGMRALSKLITQHCAR